MAYLGFFHGGEVMNLEIVSYCVPRRLKKDQFLIEYIIYFHIKLRNLISFFKFIIDNKLQGIIIR